MIHFSDSCESSFWITIQLSRSSESRFWIAIPFFDSCKSRLWTAIEIFNSIFWPIQTQLCQRYADLRSIIGAINFRYIWIDKATHDLILPILLSWGNESRWFMTTIHLLIIRTLIIILAHSVKSKMAAESLLLYECKVCSTSRSEQARAESVLGAGDECCNHTRARKTSRPWCTPYFL